jgi:predicted anti-sigma-YlaC factor YlaD
MEGSAYPAPRRAELPRKPMIVAGLASLVLGFAAATTVGMMIDEDATTTTKTRVIVSEPVATGEGVAAKDEAAVAAAIGGNDATPATGTR